MTNISQAWGAGPSGHFASIAAPLRPIFARIVGNFVVNDTAPPPMGGTGVDSTTQEAKAIA